MAPTDADGRRRGPLARGLTATGRRVAVAGRNPPARRGGQLRGHRPARSVGLAFVELRLVARAGQRTFRPLADGGAPLGPVDVEWFKQVGPIGWPEQDEIAVSGIGTITAARIAPRDGSTDPFIAISMYGRWIGSHPSVKTTWRFGYADASVHRITSDLSTFIGHENSQTHRILAAGDLNILHGYGDGGRPPYWDARYRSVFERMAAIGMEFVGPQAPDGRQAETLATHEPEDSRNVVTFYLPGRNPTTASNNQLDYVFASRGFHESVNVRAMNGVEEWGASDHCRLLIEV